MKPVTFENDFEELEKIPRTSGLYYFFDEEDKIIYIGRASNLHSRVFMHYHNHSLYREIGFFVKMLELKGLSIKEKENLPKDLLDIWYNFEEREFAHSTMLVIDFNYDKVKRIEIEEVPKELKNSKEKEMILKFEPIYNSETGSEEYHNTRIQPFEIDTN